MNEFVPLLGRILCGGLQSRRQRRLTIRILCPGEGGRDSIHIALDIGKEQVTIRHGAVHSGEVNAVIGRSIDRDIFERDIT